MAGIFDSYKKIYENKKIHIWLVIIAFIWGITSTLIDIKTGSQYKQNIADLIFEILVGTYSLQFLHNAINNIDNGILPDFKQIKPKIIWDMIKLNIVWGIYAVLCLIFAVLSYMMLHTKILPVIIIAALFFISAFVYYIYIAYAENLNTKGLYNIKLIFLFVKPAVKKTYKNLILFILFSILIAVIYILIYAGAELTGINIIGRISGDFYILDALMYTVAVYFIMVTWYFAFPYSLINTYLEKIKPVIGKAVNNDENA